MFHVKQIDEWPQYLPFLHAELFHVKQSGQFGEAEVRGSMFHVKHLHTQVTSKICFLYYINLPVSSFYIKKSAIKKSAEAL